jgi:plasmid stability protein
MPILHVRNVPDDLYERIRRQARDHRRSISAEVITMLERAMDGDGDTQAEILDHIQSRRFYDPSENRAPDSTSLLREDRRR